MKVYEINQKLIAPYRPLKSGRLDFVGGLNVDAFPKGVERSDLEVGIVNHRGVGHATIRGVLEFEPDVQGVV